MEQRQKKKQTETSAGTSWIIGATGGSVKPSNDEFRGFIDDSVEKRRRRGPSRPPRSFTADGLSKLQNRTRDKPIKPFLSIR
jgi:hypothetical protein